MHGIFNGIPLKNIIALKTKVRSVGVWDFYNVELPELLRRLLGNWS